VKENLGFRKTAGDIRSKVSFVGYVDGSVWASPYLFFWKYPQKYARGKGAQSSAAPESIRTQEKLKI